MLIIMKIHIQKSAQILIIQLVSTLSNFSTFKYDTFFYYCKFQNTRWNCMIANHNKIITNKQKNSINYYISQQMFANNEDSYSKISIDTYRSTCINLLQHPNFFIILNYFKWWNYIFLNKKEYNCKLY